MYLMIVLDPRATHRILHTPTHLHNLWSSKWRKKGLPSAIDPCNIRKSSSMKTIAILERETKHGTQQEKGYISVYAEIW